MVLSVSHHKTILSKHLNACFLWTFEYRKKRRVNKAIKIIVLIEDASDANFFPITFENIYFQSIFSSFQCLYIVRYEWDIVISNSYDGWDERGYTIWCLRQGTSTLLNCVWLYLKVVQIQQTWTVWVSTFRGWNCIKLNLLRKI